MKKKVMHLALAAVGLLMAIGMVFCIMRPSYVKEAVDILLGNDLQFEQSGEISEDQPAEQESEIQSEPVQGNE